MAIFVAKLENRKGRKKRSQKVCKRSGNQWVEDRKKVWRQGGKGQRKELKRTSNVVAQ